MARIQDQDPVRVIDPGPGFGRGNQPPEDRPDPLRVHRKVERVEVIAARRDTLASLELEQPFRIDRNGAGVDGGGGGNRTCDDLTLGQQTLHPGIDQAGAKLVEIEDADNERDQADEIDRDDPPGQGGKHIGAENPAEPVEQPAPDPLVAKPAQLGSLGRTFRRSRPFRLLALYRHGRGLQTSLNL